MIKYVFVSIQLRCDSCGGKQDAVRGVTFGALPEYTKNTVLSDYPPSPTLPHTHTHTHTPPSTSFSCDNVYDEEGWWWQYYAEDMIY